MCCAQTAAPKGVKDYYGEQRKKQHVQQRIKISCVVERAQTVLVVMCIENLQIFSKRIRKPATRAAQFIEVMRCVTRRTLQQKACQNITRKPSKIQSGTFSDPPKSKLGRPLGAKGCARGP